MSLLSSILLPKLEKELLDIQPDIAQFLLRQLKLLANEVLEWVETKIDLDINGDGQIGDKE